MLKMTLRVSDLMHSGPVVFFPTFKAKEACVFLSQSGYVCIYAAYCDDCCKCLLHIVLTLYSVQCVDVVSFKKIFTRVCKYIDFKICKNRLLCCKEVQKSYFF